MERAVSIRHLRCFLAVADSGSFTVASSRMFLTQSSLTATIQQFEEAIGLKLFDRTTRRVVMTEEGRRFRDEAQKIVQEFDTAISDLKALAQSQQGHIRIAAAASVIYQFLTRAIPVFRETYPNVTISLRDAGSEQVEQMLLNGDLDFAVTSKHKGYADLDYTPLIEDNYGVMCLPSYRLARKTRPLRWSDLPPEDYVAFSSDTGIGTFLAANAAFSPLFANPHDEVSSTTSLYPLLSLGDRYSIVPALAARPQDFPELAFRELTEPVLTRKICLITRRLRSLSPSARRILDILLETFQSGPLPPGVSISSP
ncbi:LysR family transcriptional regulator [Ramlibacter sp.]|uniref:LysR family transcriptional regulator n=1 Tax=Ramlibacter sp. TaxID=1917967 RepID=UPI002C7C0AF7|nr:LysR family transcriptional regulator [Ramlibacter sp.]HWI82940.1 LysR family transcriptional regulator [Ramlibacter sp.]